MGEDCAYLLEEVDLNFSSDVLLGNDASRALRASAIPAANEVIDVGRSTQL